MNEALFFFLSLSQICHFESKISNKKKLGWQVSFVREYVQFDRLFTSLIGLEIGC